MTSTDTKRLTFGDTFVLELYPGSGRPPKKETYRIGKDSEPKATPRIIGKDSLWGGILIGSTIGTIVKLPIEECNEIDAKITDIMSL